MSQIRLTLIGKPGCHLCDDARQALYEVTGALPSAERITFEELSILDDAQLMRQYVDDIPVVLIDGRAHTYWRVDKDRLTAALSRALDRTDA